MEQPSMTPEEVRRRLGDRTLFIVPYCHPDWAWTHTRAWHERRYVLVFEEVLRILQEAPEFRWYLDCWETQMVPLLARRPDLVPELQRRIREGSIAICGAFANIRPNLVGEETFIRNLVYGRRRFRSLFPDADLSVHADVVDVALGHAQMPQILRLAGYRYFRAWRPDTALSVKAVPYEFFWEGLDGTRILCSRGCYGGTCAPGCILPNYAEDWDQALLRYWHTDLEYFTRHCVTDCTWVSHGNDDARPLRTGPHSGDVPLDLIGFVREWNRRERSHLRFATPVEFFQALEERAPNIPVIRGTLDPCDCGYNPAWGGVLGLWQLRYLVDRELTAAEAWHTIAPIEPTAPSLITSLWENLLHFSMHATQWLFQDDYDAIRALAEDTHRQAQSLRRRTLCALARRVPQPNGCVAVVFNSLPFAREAIVPVLLTAPADLPASMRLVDGAGQLVPFQATQHLQVSGIVWEQQGLARLHLPAFGYTTLAYQPHDAAPNPPPPPADAMTCSLDNGVLQLRFQDGHLVHVHAPSGDYPAPDGLAWSLLRLHHTDPTAPLHEGNPIATDDVRWDQAQLWEAGPLRWRHVAKGSVGPHPVTLETLLFAGEPRVEFRAQVDWRGAEGYLAALWPMPFAGQITGDIPFGAETKDLDAEPFGPMTGVGHSNNIERLADGTFFARSFIDVCDGRRGIAHLQHDGDRYYVRDAKNGTLAYILLRTALRVTEGWEQHVGAQREGIGHHSITWSLLFHDGDWRTAGLVRTAAILRHPPEVILPHGAPHPDLPAHHSFLSVEPANVVLSALYTEADAVFLRLWEAEGQPAHVQLDLPFAPLSAVLVDFNGDPLPEPLPVLQGHRLAFSLRPWQIATLRLAVPFVFPQDIGRL
jgi:alpha-mannosidase